MNSAWKELRLQLKCICCIKNSLILIRYCHHQHGFQKMCLPGAVLSQVRSLAKHIMHMCTVEFVYKDQPSDQQNLVLIHHWSLYAGWVTWKVYPWRPVKCSFCKHLVFIYRWSLEQVWLFLCPGRPPVPSHCWYCRQQRRCSARTLPQCD